VRRPISSRRQPALFAFDGQQHCLRLVLVVHLSPRSTLRTAVGHAGQAPPRHLIAAMIDPAAGELKGQKAPCCRAKGPVRPCSASWQLGCEDRRSGDLTAGSRPGSSVPQS
jgi:hypothetical protein